MEDKMSYTNQNRPVTDGALETMSLIAASKVNFTNVYLSLIHISEPTRPY